MDELKAVESFAKVVMEALKKVAKFFLERLWNPIKKGFSIVSKAQADIKKTKQLRRTWHVPMNMARGNQTFNRKPAFTRVRNQI